MSRGPRMSKTVKALVTEETWNNPNKPRDLLASELQEKIERLRLPVPAYETIIKMISNVRNPDSDPMKEPWDIATLTYKEKDTIFDLRPESMPAVLQVWRYSIALDEAFTKRQAKWVSILYPFFTGELELKVVELWFQSRRFAREEELSLVTSIPMRLNVLASQLVMSDWEILCMLGADILDPNIMRFIQYTELPTAKDGGITEELLHALPLNIWERPKDDNEAKRDLALHNLIIELPSSFKTLPNIETRMIYLRHLSNMAKGSRWKELTPDELVEIILRLREWVIEWQESAEEDTIMLFTNIIHTGALPKGAFPIELYNLAGYSVEGGTK